MLLLGMNQTEILPLLDYIEDVAKAYTGPMNVDPTGTSKETLYNWETPGGGGGSGSPPC